MKANLGGGVLKVVGFFKAHMEPFGGKYNLI